MLLRTRPSAPTGALSAAGALALRATPAHLAVGRTAAGTAMIVRPRALPQLMGVDSATATRVGWAIQMLGAREVAVGLGTLMALRSPDRRASRTWVAAGILCDAVDVVAMTAALARGRVSKGAGAAVLAVAASAVALGARALEVDDAGA